MKFSSHKILWMMEGNILLLTCYWRTKTRVLPLKHLWIFITLYFNRIGYLGHLIFFFRRDLPNNLLLEVSCSRIEFGASVCQACNPNLKLSLWLQNWTFKDIIKKLKFSSTETFPYSYNALISFSKNASNFDYVEAWE